MPNVIREDVIRVGFDIDLKKFRSFADDLDDLKRSTAGGVGDDAFDDLKKSVNGAEDSMEKAKRTAGNLNDKLTTLGKKGAAVAFNGLKKIAGISFKATLAGVTAIAAGVGKVGYEAVQAYAEFEQLKGGVETLFGAKGAKTVEEYAKSVGKSVGEVEKEYKTLKESESLVLKNANNAYKTAGLSANAYMETVTSFSASLLQSLGGDTKKAAEYADMAISDMADNANKMGTDMGSIQYAYQGFAKQNYTMLDNLKLGYGGTKSEMERLVKDAAKLDKSVKANDLSYGNIVQAIHAVQKEMGIYGTTAKEAEKTVTGSLNAMKASWGNLLTALGSGENLDQCVDNMMESVETFLGNVMPVVERALIGLGSLVEKLAPVIAERLPVLVEKLLPPLIKAAVELAKGLIKALPTIIKTVAEAIVDCFGEQFPIIKKIGDFFIDNAGNIAKLIPLILGLVAAFKAFNALKGVTSIVSGLFGSKGGAGGGEGGKGGKSGGLLGVIKTYAKEKPTVLLKGIANLGIVLGGITLIAGVVTAVLAPAIAAIADIGELLEFCAVILAVGLVGAALAKVTQPIGNINVSTIAKGLANIAIVMVGMSALFAVIGAVSQMGVDCKKLLEVVAIIGIIGVVGAALAAVAALIGLIPFPVVLLGIANIALVIGALTAIGVAASFAVVVIGENLGQFAENVKPLFELFKGVDIGGVAAFFAALSLLFGTALANDVWSGINRIFGNDEIGLGKLGADLSVFATNAHGFFVSVAKYPENGFENAKKMFDCLADLDKLPYSGGIASWFRGEIDYEGIAKGLNELARTDAGFFATAAKMSPAGLENASKFFDVLSKLGGLPYSGGIASWFKGELDYTEITNGIIELSALGNAGGFFDMCAGLSEEGLANGALFFEMLSNLGNLPNSGGVASWFSGDIDYAEIGAGILELAKIGNSDFFDKCAQWSEAGLSNGAVFFEMLSKLGSLPNSGGVGSWFAGDIDYAEIASGLGKLGKDSAMKLFTKCASIPVEGFSNAKLLFDALSNIGSLPNSGGIGSWFSGDIAYEDIANGLAALSTDDVKRFFTMAQDLSPQAFTNTKQLFAVLGELGDSLPKEDGWWQTLTSSETQSLSEVGDELGDFAWNAEDFFDMVNKLDLSNLKGLWSALSGAGSLITATTSYGSLAIVLSTFAAKTAGFFRTVNKLDLEKLRGMWQALGEVTSLKGISDEIDADIQAIVKKIADMPKLMSAALKNSGASLAETFALVWKQAVLASMLPVNKLLSAANHVLKEFGSKKRVITWQPYAKGTDGHKGGNALVNDGRGAELIQMPNGKMFIPRGRNVFMPNAPQGMKVLPAEQTARLMGRKTPTFNYADGIGDLDVWDYYDNPKGLVDEITKRINYSGFSAFSDDLSRGMVSTFAGEMPAWLEKLYAEGGQSISSYNPSKGAKQWLPTVVRALKMEGLYSIENVARTLFQMTTESNGNPNAINNWDSNAKNGTPSKGLMQVIDPTFKAYAREGFDKNIYDPLSNILASVRYATARYGSLSKAYRGVGYSDGVGTVEMPSHPVSLSYTPESDESFSSKSYIVNNRYAPQFIINVSGSSNDRELARKITKVVQEAIKEMLDEADRQNPSLIEV